jgi:hypothetical protein
VSLLAQQGEPVFAHRAIADQARPIQQLDGVEVQVSKPALGIQLHQHAIRSLGEGARRIEGLTDDPEMGEELVGGVPRNVATRVVELHDALSTESPNAGDDLPQPPALVPGRTRTIRLRAVGNGEGVRVRAGVRDRLVVRAARHLHAHERGDAFLEPELPDRGPVVGHLIVIGGDQHLAALGREALHPRNDRQARVVARLCVDVKIGGDPARALQGALGLRELQTHCRTRAADSLPHRKPG